MESHNIAAAWRKLSNLLTQESNFLLGVEHYVESIESLLRDECDYKGDLNELACNIEDAITELMITSDYRSKQYDFLRYSIALGIEAKDLFFVMLVVQFVDVFKLVRKWSNMSLDFVCYVRLCSGSFEGHSDGQSIRDTIVLGTITRFEALAKEKHLSFTMQRDVQLLHDNFKSFQEFLKDVELEKLSNEDLSWIDGLFDVCCSANLAVDSFLSSSHKGKMNQKGPLKYMIAAVSDLNRHKKFATQLSEIKACVHGFTARKPQLLPRQISSNDNVRRLTLHCASDQLHIDGFEEDVDAVVEKLLVEDVHCLTVSILGVAGIGKTRLAQLVCANHDIVQHFPVRLWVSRPDEMDIMEKILGVGGCLSDDQVIKMVNTVYAGKRFLIDVDDSCASNFWKTFKGVFRNLFNSSRIIFTVHQKSKSPKISETNFNYRLHLRSDDESWAMFKRTVKTNISPEFEKQLKSRILRKCSGLPKVIINLAGLLSTREATLEEWSRVLEQLNHEEETWQQIENEINRHLPWYLRRCLFYFGLFPADYKIPARRLISLWVAEGLISGEGIDRSNDEHIAEHCLEELADYNTVQVTERKLDRRIKTCCLPQALRLGWLSRAKEANFLQGISNMESGMRRLADHFNPNDASFYHIHGNRSSNLYPSYSNSVAFLSFDTREDAGKDINKFLNRCIASNCFFFLLVLDLEAVYKPVLPKALSKLARLRYLGLRSTYLERLPTSIDKLLSLETLDLKRTCISTLPRSIWKMQNLRYLFLDQSFRTVFLPRLQDSSLQGLQTLWGIFIDERSPVQSSLDTLQDVTKLGLKSKVSCPSQKDAMHSQLRALKNWVMNLKGLVKLWLKSYDESEQPWDLDLDSLSDHKNLSNVYLVGKLMNQQLLSTFPNKLIELTLSASKLIVDPMQALEKLPGLKILRLYSKSFAGKRMVCNSGGFPNLQVLKLWELEHLQAFDLEQGSLPRLKDLEIRRCTNLKMLPDGLKHIKNLRRLKITQMSLLSHKVMDAKGEEMKKVSHVLHVHIED